MEKRTPSFSLNIDINSLSKFQIEVLLAAEKFLAIPVPDKGWETGMVKKLTQPQTSNEQARELNYLECMGMIIPVKPKEGFYDDAFITRLGQMVLEHLRNEKYIEEKR